MAKIPRYVEYYIVVCFSERDTSISRHEINQNLCFSCNFDRIRLNSVADAILLQNACVLGSSTRQMTSWRADLCR